MAVLYNSATCVALTNRMCRPGHDKRYILGKCVALESVPRNAPLSNWNVRDSLCVYLHYPKLSGLWERAERTKDPRKALSLPLRPFKKQTRRLRLIGSSHSITIFISIIRRIDAARKKTWQSVNKVRIHSLCTWDKNKMFKALENFLI